MAGGDETRPDRPVQGLIEGLCRFCMHFRNAVPDGAVEGVPLRAAQLPKGLSEDIDEIPRLFYVHRHGLPHVLHSAQSGEEECRGNRDPDSADLVVVLHAVLSRDAGNAVSRSDIVEGHVGADELSELVLSVGGLFRPDRIAPAEVVQPCQAV